MKLSFSAPLHHEVKPGLLQVEVATSFQIPAFHVIGLPSREVSESRDRVRAAIDASGLEFPRRKVTVNLSPAAVRKSGTGTDLAMALGILADSLPPQRHAKLVAWGELGLDGTIKPVGQLTRALYAAWQDRAWEIWVANEDRELSEDRLDLLREAACFDWPPPRVRSAADLAEAWEEVQRSDAPRATTQRLQRASRDSLQNDSPKKTRAPYLTLAPHLERVLAIAAAGEHHLLLLGSRGSGKTQALERLESLLPDLSPKLVVERLLIEELRTPYPVASRRQPVRRVSPQNRPASLLGQFQGALPRPGELPLAHGGILVADEFPEWARDSREALREPLEAGVCRVSRTRDTLEFPARFSLAASGNLCPCGGWPRQNPTVRIPNAKSFPLCRCKPGAGETYLARISGPLLDRIDLVVAVTPEAVPPVETFDPEALSLRDKVARCRATLTRIWGESPGRLSPERLEALIEAHPAWREVLGEAGDSLRSRHKILRTALTIAVWEGHEEPASAHFMEAASYRAETWIKP